MDTVRTMIRQARSDAGLTQLQLARRVGTAQSMIARYESGDVTPTVGALARLIAACGQELTVSTAQNPTRLYGADPIPDRIPGRATPAGISDYLNRPDPGWRPGAKRDAESGPAEAT